jgi:hypothetical protein
MPAKSLGATVERCRGVRSLLNMEGFAATPPVASLTKKGKWERLS